MGARVSSHTHTGVSGQPAPAHSAAPIASPAKSRSADGQTPSDGGKELRSNKANSLDAPTTAAPGTHPRAPAMTVVPAGVSEDGGDAAARAGARGLQGGGTQMGEDPENSQGRGKEKFKAAVRAVIQERRLQRSRDARDRFTAAARRQHEMVRVRHGGGFMAQVGRVAQSAMMALQAASVDGPPPITDAERAILWVEFDHFDKDRRGLLTINQLEKLLMKRAYYRCKMIWKEAVRRKAKTEMVAAQHDHMADAFNYSSKNNMQDRNTAKMAAKDAFHEYSCHTDGMNFESFCKFHQSLRGSLHQATEHQHLHITFDMLEEHPSDALSSPSFRHSAHSPVTASSPVDPPLSASSHARRTASKRSRAQLRPASPLLANLTRRGAAPPTPTEAQTPAGDWPGGGGRG
eukprot:CAMPEP_0173438884 /NCGR_PEP_ID=MMETSP1357-20121228/20652_1 /TAXON_ID=77926 /ORGANISM="Hemiselmis rufescens, Strain PCC563" /LENGTH=403 /DNA_ID=CAMNT_0014404207 /DNA_START=34 /DNA_END=1243 /DNA_ORIENTATION=+